LRKKRNQINRSTTTAETTSIVSSLSTAVVWELRSLHACDEPPDEQPYEYPGPPFHWLSLLLF
jgi:hypothetical protein